MFSILGGSVFSIIYKIKGGVDRLYTPTLIRKLVMPVAIFNMHNKLGNTPLQRSNSFTILASGPLDLNISRFVSLSGSLDRFISSRRSSIRCSLSIQSIAFTIPITFTKCVCCCLPRDLVNPSAIISGVVRQRSVTRTFKIL
jgi:hypothetical protein